MTASDFTIEDLAIEDTAGDALKITDGRNITVRRVRTEWTGGPSTENGAYGIYPVQTENTLIEGSVAIGASDAGIYVGQSRNVVVRDSRAEFNVAGIEIENTVHADVFGNLAVNNTGGILVFNMPDLPEEGHSTRVFNNRVVDNNTANFGIPGSAVAGVPAGSGILINANDRVEVFDNEIRNNQTANVLISSYFSANYTGEREVVETFDPYPETLLILGNTFGPGGGAPDHEGLEAVRLALYGVEGHLPDVVWDGVRHPERGAAEFAICVDNAPRGRARRGRCQRLREPGGRHRRAPVRPSPPRARGVDPGRRCLVSCAPERSRAGTPSHRGNRFERRSERGHPALELVRGTAQSSCWPCPLGRDSTAGGLRAGAGGAAARIRRVSATALRLGGD